MLSHQQGQYYDEAANAYDRLREEAEEKMRQEEQDSIQKAQEAAALERLAE
jgi:vacuolar-type H+-ATPase subunit H